MIKVPDVTVKKILIKYFCIIKEKITYMECLLQSSMFYRFYLFHSIFLCNVDSALVSHSNAYISIWNRIEMFELYSNVRIQIPVLKECVLSTAHTLEKWRLQMMKKKHIKEERDFFTSTPTLFKS